ncbi:MAG: helix-turn-helix transcriptional regulator [Rhizobiales bacterium]|nr:helix-turn-helix transcriptional regulator [Hyphomicrobiales bacterium]
MDVRQLVGLNTRRLRIAAGLSQEELAARIGVSQAYVSGLWHTALALGVRPAELLEVSAAPKRKAQRSRN